MENFRLTPEKLDVDWKIPFDIVANRKKDSWGGVVRDRWKTLVEQLWLIIEENSMEFDFLNLT